MVKSIDFDRFMMSEGTKTLILTFTSKPGQPVERTRHRIFKFEFCCQREVIFRHFIGLISDFKVTGDITKQRGFFSSIFSSTQPTPVLGNADLRYHLSRLNQNTQHIFCKAYL